MSDVLNNLTIDKSEILRRISEVQKFVSSKLNLDFDLSSEDWKELKKSLLSISLDIEQSNKKELELQKKNKTSSDVIPKLEFLPTSSISIDMFVQTISPIIESKVGLKNTPEKKELEKVYKKFTKMCEDRKNTSDEGIVEYFLQFIPTPDELKDKTPGFLAKLIDAVLTLLQKMLKSSPTYIKELWNILDNPEEFYIRLRGEIENFRKQNPDNIWASYILYIPDLFRLYVRLLIDERVPMASKTKFLGALAYLIHPLDFIPESVVGPIGYVEDIYIMTIGILDMINSNYVSKEVIYEHWIGDTEELEKLLHLGEKFRDKIDFFKKISEWFSTRSETPAY